jgi:biotin carboxyl carrier protein
MLYHVAIDGRDYQLELSENQGRWSCRLHGRDLAVDVAVVGRNVLSLIIERQAYDIRRELTATNLQIWVGNEHYTAEVRDPRSLRSRRTRSAASDGAKKLVAAMPGKVVRLLVLENAEIDAGEGVLVMEAMKMQNELKSPKKGKVKKIFVSEGSAVNTGDVLVIVE